MLDKTFDPQSVESRLYAKWEASGVFAPKDDPDAQPYVFEPDMQPPARQGLHQGVAV